MKKILITGISGFVGKFLAEHLLSKGEYEIVGTYRSENSISQLDTIKNSIKLEKADLLDPEAVAHVITSNKPDAIFHLAAMTSPKESFDNPSQTITNNITSQLNILEVLRTNAMKQVRTLIIASSEVYGMIDKSDLPVDEETKLQPISPYAVSKIAQDYLGLQYYLTHKLDIIRVRPFNHVGPGQSNRFIVSDFAQQIAEIEKGKRDPVMKVGNLDAKRDFTDVRDIVKAYGLLLEKGVAGDVYNIGSGRSYKIKDILSILLSFSKKETKIVTDPAKVRPVDIEEIICDSSKLHTLTGWKTEITLEKTLQDVLDYWREIV
ncbi:MAG TPA: GDP-mannose 4,6-dehydratase [Methylomirabilota bacterium]|nr:GDP-mannose 4,6-dehydratase [Methylomirabilota bacterium]